MKMKLAGLLAVLGIFLSSAAFAGQQAGGADDNSVSSDLDDFEPAVSTSALEQSDFAERDEQDESASDASVSSEADIAADVRRRERVGGVMDELDLGRTEITGNQELPKVLYIVPWKKSDPGDLSGKPVNSLLDEVLAPIDRVEFVRQVDYYGELYGEDEDGE